MVFAKAANEKDGLLEFRLEGRYVVRGDEPSGSAPSSEDY